MTQICLESLPISSSGHLMLASMLCHAINGCAVELPKHFDHFLHGPTLVVLAVFFFSSWWPMVKCMGNSLMKLLRGKRLSDSQRFAASVYAKIFVWVACADVITIAMYCFGKLLNKTNIVVPSNYLLLFGFIVTMLLFGLLWYKEKFLDQSTHKKHGIMHAFILGFVQGLALIPGISRFASTFIVARLLGYSARRAFATSFALFAPLVIAGFLLNGVAELVMHPEWLSLFTPILILTMVGSTIIAYGLFCLAYRMACAHRLWWFGVYLLMPVSLSIWLIIR